MDIENTEIKRLRWQCRRGMREMDMLLERWLDRHYQTASTDLLQTFAQVLATEDDQLWDFLMGKSNPECKAQSALIAKIREGFARA